MTEKGFSLIDGGQAAAEFDWIHVTEIVAYRRDPEGEDLLCLGFRAAASRNYVEVDEETDGYSKLLAAMYEAFPAISRDWWQDIAQPLGTNRETIYGMAMSEENEEPAASKYLKSLSLQKKQSRLRRRLLLVMLSAAVVFGIILGLLSARSSGGWLVIVGCAIQFIVSTAVLRRIKSAALTLVLFAVSYWLAAFLCR